MCLTNVDFLHFMM